MSCDNVANVLLKLRYIISIAFIESTKDVFFKKMNQMNKDTLDFDLSQSLIYFIA